MTKPLIIAAALFLLFRCPYWRRNGEYALLYTWGIWAALAHAGLGLNRYRWPLAGLMALAGLLWANRRGGPRLDRVNTVALVFVLLTLTSAIYAVVPEYALFRAMALFLVYCFIFFGVRSLLSSQYGDWYVVRCMVAGLLMGALVVVVTGSTQGIAFSTDKYRFHGVYKATGVGSIAATIIPLLLWRWKYDRLKSRRWITGALIAFLLVALLATRTRTYIFAATLVIPATVGAFWWGRRLGAIVAASLVTWVLLVVLFTFGPTDKIRAFLRIESVDEVTRTRVDTRWRVAWPRALKRPIIGWGFGSSRYYEYSSDRIGWSFAKHRAQQTVLHNQHLTIFYELGILGLMPFWLFLYAVARKGLVLISLPNSEYRDMLLAVFFSWCVKAINTMSHDGLLTVGNPNALWFWVQGLVVIGCDLHARRVTPSRQVLMPGPSDGPGINPVKSGGI